MRSNIVRLRWFHPVVGSLLLGTWPFSCGAADVVTTRLENGLEVVMVSLPDEVFVQTGLFFQAGASQDPPGREGLAHLVEHLLFTSSATYPEGGLSRELTLWTAYHNAWTNHHSMVLRNTVLPDFLPQLLAIEADRLANLEATPSELERERLIVLEEMALRARNTPFDELVEEVFSSGYAGHPFERPIVGTRESVLAITRDDVDAFRRDHLRPGNAVLVVVGPVDPSATLVTVSETLGKLIDTAADRRSAVPDAAVFEPTTVVIDRSDHDGFFLAFGLRIPVQRIEDLVKVHFVEAAMRQVGYFASFRQLPGEVFIYFGLNGDYFRPPTDPEQHWGYVFPDFDPDQDAHRALGYFWERMDRILGDLTEEESFSRARMEQDRQISQLFHDPGQVVRRLGTLSLQNASQPTEEQLIALADSISQADYLSFWREAIKPKQTGIGICHGRDSDRLTDIDLTKKVSSDESLDIADPLAALTTERIEPVLSAYLEAGAFQIEQFQISGGVSCFYLPIPTATRQIIGGVQSFACLDEEKRGKKRGLCQLYNMVIDHGYKSPPKNRRGEVVRRIQPYESDFWLLPFQLQYSATGTAGEIAAVSRALAKRIDSKDFNLSRWRAILRFGEEYFAGHGRSVRTKAVLFRWATLFGEDHPVLGRWDWDPRTVRNIKYKDLQKLQGRFRKKAATSLVAVGNVDADSLASVMQAEFVEVLEYVPVKESRLPDGTLDGIKGQIVPGFEMTDVKLDLSFTPVSIRGPDAVSPSLLFLMNELLQKRLESALRLQLGLTYAVQVDCVNAGDWVVPEIATSCQPGQGPSTLAVIRKELAALGSEALNRDAVHRAKLIQVGKLIGNATDQEQGFNLLMRYASLGEIPTDPVVELLAITDKDLERELQRYAPADHFVFTASGPIFEEDLELYFQD